MRRVENRNASAVNARTAACSKYKYAREYRSIDPDTSAISTTRRARFTRALNANRTGSPPLRRAARIVRRTSSSDEQDPKSFARRRSSALSVTRLRVRGTPIDQMWQAMTLPPDRRSPMSARLLRFLASPDALMEMHRAGSGVPATRFRPPVYVTIWS